jgi:hypothetical protein
VEDQLKSLHVYVENWALGPGSKALYFSACNLTALFVQCTSQERKKYFRFEKQHHHIFYDILAQYLADKTIFHFYE